MANSYRKIKINRKSLLFGGIILLFANGITKILGFIYRVALTRILGAEGIGLTEMLTPIYSFALVLSSFGIPLSMSKLIAHEKNQENIRKICKIGFFILGILAIFTSLMFFFFSPLLIEKFSADIRVLQAFQCLVPAIFIVTICSGYRAYFQGTKEISTLGISQNIEQMTRVILGILLCSYLMKYPLHIAIIGVSIATVFGELAGLLFLVIRYRKENKPKEKASKTKNTKNISYFKASSKIIKYMFSFGAPVTLQRLISSLVLMLQAFLIPYFLQKSGLTIEESTKLYGAFSGIAMTLVFLPAVITNTLGTIALPAVAEYGKISLLSPVENENNIKPLSNRINLSLEIITLVSLPAMLYLFYYAEFLSTFLFHTKIPVNIVKTLALGGIFLYANHPIVSILQGLGRVKIILANLTIASLCWFFAIITLVPNENFLILGGAVATIIYAMVYVVLNLLSLIFLDKAEISFKRILFIPLLAFLPAYIIFKAVVKITTASNILNLFLPTSLSLIIYLFAFLILRKALK